jgi:hypothetical protein
VLFHPTSMEGRTFKGKNFLRVSVTVIRKLYPKQPESSHNGWIGKGLK